MLALSAGPNGTDCLAHECVHLSGLTAMRQLPLNNPAHSSPLPCGCQAGTNGVEYRFEHISKG